METKTVVVTMTSPITITGEPSLRELEQVLKERLQNLLAREESAVLGNSTVEDVEIIVPTAAAGEVRARDTVLYAEEFFCLSNGQRNRVESLLKDWLAPTSVQVLTAQLSKRTNTLIASIRFQDESGRYTEQWYTQTLLPGTVSFIFG